MANKIKQKKQTFVYLIAVELFYFLLESCVVTKHFVKFLHYIILSLKQLFFVYFILGIFEIVNVELFSAGSSKDAN